MENHQRFLVIVFIASTACAYSFAVPLSSGNQTQNLTQSEENQDRVMYSFAEASVDSGNVPIVRQLTIVKGKDGETRFAKNENGTVETGKWKGPVPSGPDASYVSKMVANSIPTTNDEILGPLTKLNQQIGSNLQKYMQIFNFF